MQFKRKLESLENEIKENKRIKLYNNEVDNLRDEILLMNIDINTKTFILDKHDNIQKMHGSDFTKGMNWLKTVCNIPYGIYKPLDITKNDSSEIIKEYFKNIKLKLDESIHGLEEVKQEILEFVARKVTNPESKGHILALYGNAGVGKSKILKTLGKALNLPLYQINFGGLNDVSLLTGHSETYIGSKPGKIVEILQNSNCMNPIIYFDECFPYEQLIETDNGLISIGKLYKDFKLDKQIPKIKSFNEKLSIFEYKNITNVWEKENSKLLKLQFQNLTTTCTENHLFLTERGYIKAKDILFEDKIISQPSRGSAKILNDDQYQILLGSFLGDGHIYKLKSGNKGLKVRHGIKQEEYCIWKANIFNVKCSYLKKNGYSQTPSVSFDTKILHIKNDIPDTKHTCPQWIIDDLDWRGIAIWFMDDGSINQCYGYSSANISTNSFDEDTHKRLTKKLNDMNIECSYIKYDKGYNITLTSNGYKNLIIQILKYIHPSMIYKVNPSDIKKRKLLESNINWSFSEIQNPINDEIYNIWSCTSQKVIEYKYKFCKKCDKNMYCLLNKSKIYYQCYHKKIRNDDLYKIKHEKMYTWNNKFLEYEYMFLKNKEYLPLKNIKVYDIEIQDNHNFVIVSSINTNRSGIVVHNCDKISENKAVEINGILTHILDEEQNSHFQDNYLSNVNIDLSKVFFVLAFNDITKIDKIVCDRLKIIYIDPPKLEDKITICSEKMIPEILKSMQIKNDINIIIDKEVIEYIIVTKTQKEQGVRQLRKNIEKIANRINYDILLQNSHRFKYESERDIIITRSYVDLVLLSPDTNKDYLQMYI